MVADLEKLLLSIASFERSRFFKFYRALSREEPGLRWSEKLERILLQESFSERKIQLSTEQQFISILSPDYPEVFRELSQPPLGLFVWGEWPLPGKWLSIVGSRKPTPYSLRMTRTCVREAVMGGFGVVSGGALGIDGEAHRACVELRGKTIAFLGGGFSHLYPKAHQNLFEKIRRGHGALVSEYAPFVEPRAYHFPERNRLIASLCERLLLVQAHAKSGSMITAKEALEMGREVDVLRPPLGDENYAGSLALIEAGARVISHPKDWISRDSELLKYQI